MQDKTKRPFAVFDIDGTLIRWQLFHAIVHHLGKHGHISPAAHDRIRAARAEWKRHDTDDGFTLYERVLVHEYIAALKTIDQSDHDAVVHEVLDEYKDQTFAYTRDLLISLKARGYVLLAISGSQQEIVEELGKYYGFDDVVGAKIEHIDGKFTGNIISPIFDKAGVLRQLIDSHNLTTAGSYGVGDSKSDAAMLAIVENPIAFNPDKAFFSIAQRHRWQIVVERKNMIYKLEPHDQHYVLKHQTG